MDYTVGSVFEWPLRLQSFDKGQTICLKTFLMINRPLFVESSCIGYQLARFLPSLSSERLWTYDGGFSETEIV